MRRAPVERDRQDAASEPHLVGQVVAVGVDHHRGVHPVERALAGQVLLAGVALLGRRPEQHDAAGEGVRTPAVQRVQREKRPDAARRDDVVAAAVPDAGQGVVLGADRHRAAGVPGDELGAQRRLQPVDADRRLDAVPGQQGRQRGGRAVLLERGLRVLVEVERQVAQLAGEGVRGIRQLVGELAGRAGERRLDPRRRGRQRMSLLAQVAAEEVGRNGRLGGEGHGATLSSASGPQVTAALNVIWLAKAPQRAD